MSNCYNRFHHSTIPVYLNKWAASWQNQQSGMCAQRRLRSPWASAQFDQSLRCPHEESSDPLLPIECTAKTDQTRRMPRLIWVYVRCTCHFVGFVMRRLNCLYWPHRKEGYGQWKRGIPGDDHIRTMLNPKSTKWYTVWNSPPTE